MQVSTDQTEGIARVCHEANRAYCLLLGDDSQPPWDTAPDWQKSSAVNGVHFLLNNPEAGPHNCHGNWMVQNQAEGWTYGPVKQTDAKQHPCMVPWEHLPREQQMKDRIFHAIVRAMQ